MKTSTAILRSGRAILRRCIAVALLSAAVALPSAGAVAANRPFTHPGLLHTDADFSRIKTRLVASTQPWQDGWNRLTANGHASLFWTARPQAVVYRGYDGVHSENYSLLYNDVAAAYALALRWKISGDSRYADKAVEIMNAWSGTLTAIRGTSDAALAAGIYGYEFANAAELMRGYSGWSAADFKRFQSMMLTVFYPINHDFLVRHNNARIDHYWANWDLAQMASILAIGVLTDRRDLYAEAISYFKSGAGNGSVEHLVWKLYPGHAMGQVQESGRDQGHASLDIALVGALCQMAWNQGTDLFNYDNARVLRGAEYVAAYNLGERVPYTTYTNSDVTQPEISSAGRGNERPAWELLYNHYVVLKGFKAPHVAAFAAKLRPEGGGGNYGPNSGGYDQLGYGTLMYTLQPTR
ncbi:alginate lyase family protein [Inquilinus sp. OTU3971]|uniref:alginate lyase family protein n=1 Tax=Inquilinus sp. OTU3971 TaxID=3043855 RepID=UPI00313D430B